jgi:hypothetical protein
MIGNGQASSDAEEVLCWPKRLLSADDLRRHLHGQRTLQLLPRTLITPLAADELRARGIQVTWQASGPLANLQSHSARWGYAQEKADPLVIAAIQTLERDGVALARLPGSVSEVASQIARADCLGAILFCADPSFVCCLANKYPGLRAAAIASALHAGRARTSLGANLFAVEMPGRTYFELRQIVRTIAAAPPTCPADLAITLKELDGHAHR